MQHAARLPPLSANPTKRCVPETPTPISIRPPQASQLAEVYWMALARDVPFSQYGVDDITVTAAGNIGNCAVISNNSLRVTEAVAVVATVATVAVAFFVLVLVIVVVAADVATVAVNTVNLILSAYYR